MAKPKKKLIFYVDMECTLSNPDRCSYYSSDRVQKQAANSAKKMWDDKCCPTVYVKTERNKYAAFCPTRGGPWGEQLPEVHHPSSSALRIELAPKEGESWAETVERAAKTACESKC